MSQSVYTHSLKDKREIRLLRITPGFTEIEGAGRFGDDGDSSLLRCELNVHSFDAAADGGPDYVALSYVWGTEADDNIILINGQRVSVKANLFCALQSLQARQWRDSNPASYIWADAICINQCDSEEKRSQIGLMGEIYARAKETIIWLGPASVDSDLAMDTVAMINRADLQEPRFSELRDAWRAITSLLRRKWWTRVWVLQEAFLSKQPVAKCGDKEIPFERFVVLRELYDEVYWEAQERWLPVMLFHNVPFTSCLSNWHIIKRELADIELSGGSSILIWSTSMTSRLEVTEPRDRFFGVLGMVNLAQREAILWDYDKPMRDILIDIVLQSISFGGCLFLSCVGPEDHKKYDVPSWVPDISVNIILQQLVAVSDPKDAFTANLRILDPAWDTLSERAANIPASEASLLWNFNRQKEVFIMYGILCDIITYADPMPFVEQYNGHDNAIAEETRLKRGRISVETYKKWEPLALAVSAPDAYAETPGGRLQAFWWTLSCGRGVKGKPMVADSGDRYQALLGRRPPPDCDVVPDIPMNNNWVRGYGIHAVAKCMQRSFVLTMQGRMGLVISGVQEGDLVIVARGGEVPYVVRRLPDWGFRFVGEAYIHGIMNGEAVQEAIDQNRFLLKFLLR